MKDYTEVEIDIAFNIYVTQCISSFNPEPAIDEQFYTVGEASKTIKLPNFTIVPSGCKDLVTGITMTASGWSSG